MRLGGFLSRLLTCASVANEHGYLQVFEEEFARFKGHFGPINTLAFHPSGNGVVSGGEDGYIRIQEFDSDYSSFVYDC